MQTELSAAWRNTAVGDESAQILKTCVHCGFCNATCPTYQLVGDELDGPRGRIYLLKNVFEGGEFGTSTQTHLDRCLTCRACETTCPSGVRYGRLLELGREIVEESVARPVGERLVRGILWRIFTHRTAFRLLLRIGQRLRPLLPRRVAQKIPPPVPTGDWPPARHARRMLVLDGCVQQSLAPNINSTVARVLDRLGISLLRESRAHCCGALPLHLSAGEAARDFMRRNIDAWWPLVMSDVEAIVMTASGCGVTVRDYATYLADDPAYARKAEQVASKVRDVAEIVADEMVGLADWEAITVNRDIVFHPPCSLQHGQQIRGVVENILSTVGYRLHQFADPHLCCGSAGTYSLLQSEMADALRKNKLAALQATDANCIVTANIGCQVHLASEAEVPVRHWIELLDRQDEAPR